MKKVILLSALLGGVFLFSTTASADSGTGTTPAAGTATNQTADSGTTDLTAATTAGDISLTVDPTVDFGSKPLADVVAFGTKEINYTVTDYTGTTDGFTLTAKLKDDDATESLKLDTNELSTTAINIAAPTTDVFGDNAGKTSADLTYTGVKTVTTLTSTIEWNLTKATVTP